MCEMFDSVTYEVLVAAVCARAEQDLSAAVGDT
jgi:hypothetical protein